MKLDFLKTLQEVQPCGLRPVMEILDESYPVMAFSDWKELAIQLIDAGFVKRHNNGQYQITPAGKEAISHGLSFLDDALSNEQDSDELPDDKAESESTNEPEKLASSKPASEHPWRKPLMTNNQIADNARGKESNTKSVSEHESNTASKSHNNSVSPKCSGDSDFIMLPKTGADSELTKLSVDELLLIFNLGRSARDLIEHRLRKHSFLADEEEVS
ncbi:MAG: hypothetical protein CMF17_11535 [Idiomarinaceae bacterium]|nr:hypothetical protein [Idiomarinaceae bacterium]